MHSSVPLVALPLDRLVAASALRSKAGIPDRFRAFYDEPHSFTPTMQVDAVAWLERWL